MPALAIAAALASTAGARARAGRRGARGRGAALLPTRDFRFHLLPTEPIYRRTWWKNLRWPLHRGAAAARGGAAASSGAAGSPCSAPAATPRGRWSGARRGAGSPPRSRNRTPSRASPPAGSAGGCGTSTSVCPRRGAAPVGTRTQVFDTGNPIVPPTPERRARRSASIRPHGPKAGAAGHRRQSGRAGHQSSGRRRGSTAGGPSERVRCSG